MKVLHIFATIRAILDIILKGDHTRKHADKEYTKTLYIGLRIGWEVLSRSEAIAWRSLSEQLITLINL
jgi:hypothetical protein